jgi:hypothetical protein
MAALANPQIEFHLNCIAYRNSSFESENFSREYFNRHRWLIVDRGALHF